MTLRHGVDLKGLFRRRQKPPVVPLSGFAWRFRLTVCCILALAFGTFVAWALRPYGPLYVAAFGGPLWAVIGAAYATNSEALRAQASPGSRENTTANTTPEASPK